MSYGNFVCGNVPAFSAVGHNASVFVGGAVSGVSVCNGVVMGGGMGEKLDIKRIRMAEAGADVKLSADFALDAPVVFSVDAERVACSQENLTFFRVEGGELRDIVCATRCSFNGTTGKFASPRDAKKLYNPGFTWTRSVRLDRAVVFRDLPVGATGTMKIKAKNVLAGSLNKTGAVGIDIRAAQPALRSIKSSGSGCTTIRATCKNLERVTTSGSGALALKADQPKLRSVVSSGSGSVRARQILGTRVRKFGSGSVKIGKVTATPYCTLEHCGAGDVKFGGGRIHILQGSRKSVRLGGNAKLVSGRD